MMAFIYMTISRFFAFHSAMPSFQAATFHADIIFIIATPARLRAAFRFTRRFLSLQRLAPF